MFFCYNNIELWTEENYLTIIKAIYEKSIANIILKGKRKFFPKRTIIITLTTSIQQSIKVLVRTIRQEIKGIQIGKGELE